MFTDVVTRRLKTETAAMAPTLAGLRPAATARTVPRETRALTAPASTLMVRLTAALLALAVSAVHVADQGGITAFNAPDWIGWSYRLIEAGGVLTAIALLATFLPWSGPRSRSCV